MMIRPSELPVLASASEVIDACGGNSGVQALSDGRASQASVSNWRAAGRLPPWTFLLMLAALNAAGKTASPELWGIASPVSVDA